MNVRPASLRLSLAVAFLSSVMAGWWTAAGLRANAQTYCPIPETMGDHGDYNRGRWESFQSITVKLYPGHFNSSERQALREVLDEFEAARDTNCSQVQFISMVEEEFPIAEGETPGYSSAVDTLYILRRSVTANSPTSATRTAGGGTAGHATTPRSSLTRIIRLTVKLYESIKTAAIRNGRPSTFPNSLLPPKINIMSKVNAKILY